MGYIQSIKNLSKLELFDCVLGSNDLKILGEGIASRLTVLKLNIDNSKEPESAKFLTNLNNCEYPFCTKKDSFDNIDKISLVRPHVFGHLHSNNIIWIESKQNTLLTAKV
jgi:hypothetical protein